MRGSRLLSVVSLVPFLLLTTVSSQDSRNHGGTAGMDFAYRFENERFVLSLIEVDVEPDGSGEVRFKRGEFEEIIDVKFKLMPSTHGRLQELVHRTRFLTSDSDYQHVRDFSHLGWSTVKVRMDDLSREIRVNHTGDQDIGEMIAIFRGIANQEIHVFDLDLAQQYQPLELPRALERLANDLSLGRLAEPERMVPVLRDIAGSDTLPLIGRNIADRVIRDIERKKFKSPVRMGK